jgi:hypothetical protein
MAEAVIGLPDRVINAADEILHLGLVADPCLNDRELVAAKSRDQVVFLDAAANAFRNSFQKLVAYVVTKGIVNALELIDVDVQQRKLFALAGSL